MILKKVLTFPPLTENLGCCTNLNDLKLHTSCTLMGCTVQQVGRQLKALNAQRSSCDSSTSSCGGNWKVSSRNKLPNSFSSLSCSSNREDHSGSWVLSLLSLQQQEELLEKLGLYSSRPETSRRKGGGDICNGQNYDSMWMAIPGKSRRSWDHRLDVSQQILPDHLSARQCFKYQVSAIYRSAKLYTGDRVIYRDMVLNTSWYINSQYIYDIIKRNKLLFKYHIKTSLKYHNEHRIK